MTFKRSALVWENQKLPRVDPWDGQRTGGGGGGPRPALDPWDGQRIGGGGAAPRGGPESWRKTEAAEKSGARHAGRLVFAYRMIRNSDSFSNLSSFSYHPSRISSLPIFLKVLFNENLGVSKVLANTSLLSRFIS